MAVISAAMVALAAGSALGSAIPAHFGTTKPFSVQQVANPHYVRHGPSALLKAYRKYGATVPESLLQAAGQGSAVTTPEVYDVRIIPGFCDP
jgi:aspergillopepsin I